MIGFHHEQGLETSEEDREILQRVFPRRDFKVGANASDAAETEDGIDTRPDESEDDHA